MTPLIPDPEIWAKLTEREQTVFAMICEGLPDKAIANKLGLSHRTIINYVQSMSHKARTIVPLPHHTRTCLVAAICRTIPPAPNKVQMSDPREISEAA